MAGPLSGLSSVAPQNRRQRRPPRGSGFIAGTRPAMRAATRDCISQEEARGSRAPRPAELGVSFRAEAEERGRAAEWRRARPGSMDEDGLPIVGSGIDLTKVRAALARRSGAAASPPRRRLRWPWCWVNPASLRLPARPGGSGRGELPVR